MKIFISYGHDAYAPVAKRISEDLTFHGFEVWFDKTSINVTRTWDNEIEKGINGADYILMIITNHALRRPDGVCLDELSYARMLGKPIAPVMIEFTKPPLLISRIQWLDMQDVLEPSSKEILPDKYNAKLEKLLNVLNSKDCLIFEGSHNDLRRILKPFDHETDMAEKLNNFTGREWLYDEYDNWVKSDFKSRVFCIIGEAGCGKSCMAAKLAHSHDSVIGVHFCKYYDTARRDVKRILLSLAYTISTQIKEYSLFISENIDFDKIENRCVNEIFEQLYIAPLNKIASPNRKVVVIIDGVDEIEEGMQKEFFTILSENASKFPKWFGMVITSRPESNILSALKVFNPHKIDAKSESNIQDIQEYVNNKLKGVNLEAHQTAVKEIVRQSEGNFLYIKHFVEEILKSNLETFDFASFPVGMSGVYTKYFERTFTDDNEYKTKIRPFFEVIATLKCPASSDTIKDILKTDEYEMEEIFESVGTMINNHGDEISFFHKSLCDWLNNKDNSKSYFVSHKPAEKRICDWITGSIKSFPENKYMLNYGFEHLASSRDYKSIGDILSTRSSKVSAAFTTFICGQVRTDNAGSIEELFRYLTTECAEVEETACESLTGVIDHGYLDFAKRLATSIALNERYAWVTKFCELATLRVTGSSKRLIEEGEDLLTKAPPNANVCAQIYYLVADGYRENGKHAKASDYYKKALKALKSNDASSRYIDCLCALTDLEYASGNISEANAMLDNVKNNYKVKANSSESFKMYRLSGNIHHSIKDLKRARADHMKSLEIAQKTMTPHNIARACNSLAETFESFNNESEMYITRARKTAETIGAGLEHGKSFYIEAELLFSSNMYDTAIEQGKTAHELLTKVGYGSGIARCNLIIGKAYLAQDKFSEALEHLLKSSRYYIEQKVYPYLRFESFHAILKCAQKIKELKRYKKYDDLFKIEKLENYKYLECDIKDAAELMKGS